MKVGDIIKKHNVRGNYSIGQIVSIVAGEFVVEVIKTVRNGKMVPKKTSVSHEYYSLPFKNVGTNIEVLG